MHEYEKKILISASEYNLIRKLGFGFGAAEVHTNYYYDTDDQKYNKQNITLRIREKNGEFEATIKNHDREIENHSTEETAECRDEHDATFFKDHGVKLQGMLMTERCISEPEYGIRIMLDRNWYLGRCDHEIEFEYDEGYESKLYYYVETLISCFIHYGLISAAEEFNSRETEPMSKSQRFFLHLDDLKYSDEYIQDEQ